MDAERETNSTEPVNQTPESELTEERFLEAYKKKVYPKPSLTADIAVFRREEDSLSVLMVRRGKHPFKGCWALPGGFVGQDEDVIEAARRELQEETGVTDIQVELFGIYGTPGRDPRGWTVSGGFCALLDDVREIAAGDDAADAQWCLIRENTPDNVVELVVTCGTDDVLTVRFERIGQSFGPSRASVIESCGFAFDHAQLLADAYLKVCE